jgi:hypothetical protein
MTLLKVFSTQTKRMVFVERSAEGLGYIDC